MRMTTPTKKLTIFSLLVLLALSSAADMGQTMSGQADRSDFENAMDNYDQSSSYVHGTSPEEIEEPTEKSNYVPGAITEEPVINGDERGHFVSGTIASPDQYLKFSNKEIVTDIYHKANRAFSFSYFQDNYDVKDERGVYGRTFDGGKSDSVRGGFLLLNWDYFFTRRLFSPFVGAGAGFGFSTGKGSFVNGEKSLAKFNLWMIPVDLHLGTEISLSRYFSLSLMGGPSAMGLWQDRDDRDQGDDKKTKRQFSRGYFATVKFGINFSQIFTNKGFNVYKSSNISNLALNLEARTHNYSDFADNISISGTSFGIGFSFEYL